MPPLDIILFSVNCLCAYYCIVKQMSCILGGVICFRWCFVLRCCTGW